MGEEFLTLTFNELDKNHQQILDKEFEKECIMYAQPNDLLCPIASFRKYISKLNLKCEAFFQRAKPKFSETDTVWYENKPLGVNTIGNLMKEISLEGKLSKMYTNHCLRATVLANKGSDWKLML